MQTDKEPLRKLCPFLHIIAGQAGMGLLTSFDSIGYQGGNKMNAGFLAKQGARPSCITEDSGGGQVSEECEKHFAELLGNDYYITGRVNVADKILSVSFELHDIHTGKLISRSETFTSRSRSKMMDAIIPLVVRMVHAGLSLPMREITKFVTVKGVKKKVTAQMPVPELPADDEQVTVRFGTLPVVSALYLDGHLLCPKTPCTLRLMPGMHHSRFEADRYAPATVEFDAEDEMEVKVTLTSRFGWVNVDTLKGVKVMIDGTFVQFPETWREVDEGKVVTVAVADRCYLPTSAQVTVKGGERRSVKLEAKPRLAGLKVKAYDAKGKAVDSYVKLKQGIVGKTGEILNVPLCSTIMTVSFDDDIFGTKLQLKEGEVTVVTAKAAPIVKKGAMVMLPGGIYSMAYTNRDVTVAPFLLDVTEVTAGAYRDCVKAGKCTEPQHKKRKSAFERFANWLLWGGEWTGFESPQLLPVFGCTYDEPGKENHPINCLNWDQANAYCSWRGKRLPTEEEWEWASQGADFRTKSPWGNEAPTDELLCVDEEGDTHELRMQREFYATCAVGAYPQGDSPQGIKDLGGNVAEWTSSTKEASSRGTKESELRVYRGGFWGSFGATSEYRNGYWERVSTRSEGSFTGSVVGRGLELPSRARNSIGFRCAKTP